MPSVSIDRDVVAGLFFMALATLGLLLGANYEFGTTAGMGPGFVPNLLCWAMLGLGCLITVTGFLRANIEAMGPWAWGQLLAVLNAVLLFGATLESVGMELAIMGAILVSGISRPQPRRIEKTGLAIATIAFALHLWPGMVLDIKASGYGAALRHAPLGVGVGASAMALLTHARRTELAILVERVTLAALLAVFSIIIFIDGLGLTMRSMIVLDVWGRMKDAVIRPAVLALKPLIGL